MYPEICAFIPVIKQGLQIASLEGIHHHGGLDGPQCDGMLLAFIQRNGDILKHRTDIGIFSASRSLIQPLLQSPQTLPTVSWDRAGFSLPGCLSHGEWARNPFAHESTLAIGVPCAGSTFAEEAGISHGLELSHADRTESAGHG
jgi:hypothetical protein